MPKIKFNGLEKTQRGRFQGFLIKGVKEKDGKDWDTFLFAETKQQGGYGKNPLVATLEGTPIGSIVNVIMQEKKSGDRTFWNCVDVEVLEEGDGTPTHGQPTNRPSRGGQKSFGSGGGKGNFRDPDHIDRSAASNLAMDLTKILVQTGCLGKAPKEDLILQKFKDLTIECAEYIMKGTGFDDPADAGADTPDNVGQSDPAPDEDDDIPF